MATLRQMLEKRSALQAELRTIHDGSPDAPLPADKQTRWDATTADLETLQGQIDRQALLDDYDRRSGTGVPLDGGSGSFDALAARVSILDVLRAQTGATDEGANRAREVSAELERRSGRKAAGLLFSMAHSAAGIEKRVFMTTNPPAGPGSNLIATDVSSTMIDRLRERLVIRRLGATILSGLVGNLSIPRLKASATATWVHENESIPPSDPQTDSVGLTPKHVGGLVEISRQMLQQSSPDVALMVENDLAAIIAKAIDAAAIGGTGGVQPVGLLNPASDIQTKGMSGSAPTWGDVIDCIASVDTANALSGSLAWLTNGHVVARLRKTLTTPADTSSNFLMSEPAALAGYPLASTMIMPMDGTTVSESPLSSLIFGSWENLIVGYWSELDILVNPYAEQAYSRGGLLVRAMATCDVAVKQPMAFSALLGVGTA